MSTDYDLCILGAGPAGFAAAMRAQDLGRRALIIERDRVGGTGIHNGALSSKTLWEIAKDYATACRTDRGYRAEQVHLAYPEVTEAVRLAQAERRGSLERQLGAPDGPRPAITLVRGRARFVSPHQVEVVGADGAAIQVTATNYLIATGSRPRALPGVDADGARVLTSDHIESLPSFPERLVVIGAGVVGCEYATVFARFGHTDVHLLDREPRILPFEDEDLAQVITASFTEVGMTIHHKSRLAELTPTATGVDVAIDGPHGRVVIPASHVLLSIGRVPNTDGIGLDAANVATNPAGTVLTENTRSTSQPHIYAAGDTTADVALANVAELEGRHAVERMFGLDPQPLRYGALSSILFLAPEVAAVGLNEQQAKKQGVRYRVAVLANTHVPRNIAMRSTRGFVKLLADPDGKLLGLRVVGPQASSTIQGVALLIDRGGTLDDIDRCIHPHPAIPEGVQECARLLLGRSLNRPELDPTSVRVGEG